MSWVGDHPACRTLVSFPDNHDRLWLLWLEDGTSAAITDYNWELTGYDPRLGEIDPLVFHYGGNVYYITGPYAQERGWRVEEVEDRKRVSA